MLNSRRAMASNISPSEIVDISDERPIAVRRKRRISTGLADQAPGPTVQKTEDDVEHPMPAAKTPTKSKKRVRFSDPGPEVSTAAISTGLTPHLRRTSFSPRLRGSAPSTPSLLAAGHKRLALPMQLSYSLPSPSLSPPPGPLSGEIHIVPLRQILDSRLKRRLRRNGLSEEMNDIEEERKSASKWRQEIQDLKEELALAKQSTNEEHSHGIEEESTSSVRVRELEQQLDDMRSQMRERSMTVEPAAAATRSHDLPTPEIDIFVDNTYDEVIAPSVDDGGGPRDLRLSKEATTQASLPSPSHTETFREARLSLEYLFPGEITLGLVPEDPKPLLEVMFERMRRLKADLLFADDQLSTTSTSESNLRTQFNAVLEQLDRARKYGETISTRISNEKARADTSQAKVQSLEVAVQNAANKVEVMEKESSEKERSMKKLQDVLESYRVEVGKLESLITRMEADHNAAISAFRAEMDEAVADLDCHVVAETRGRREAEQEVAERDEKIRQLKVHEQELREALNEKQQIIRKTERVFEEERIGREREVGGLNVQIGQLTSDLSESDAKVTAGEAKEAILMRKLEEERDAGLRAVEAVQEKLAHATEKAEGIKTAYVHDVQRRGAEVTQNQGLLTPVTVTRFKDVDVQGYVQVRRGKGKAKKRDSGIVILEEDEDEDTIMADDL